MRAAIVILSLVLARVSGFGLSYTYSFEFLSGDALSATRWVSSRSYELGSGPTLGPNDDLDDNTLEVIFGDLYYFHDFMHHNGTFTFSDDKTLLIYNGAFYGTPVVNGPSSFVGTFSTDISGLVTWRVSVGSGTESYSGTGRFVLASAVPDFGSTGLLLGMVFAGFPFLRRKTG